MIKNSPQGTRPIYPLTVVFKATLEGRGKFAGTIYVTAYEASDDVTAAPVTVDAR